MSTPHILPDSRCREASGVIPTARGNAVPIYCANCGKFGGYVAEKHCTFDFYLCDPCAAVYGNDAHFYVEPDHVFWARVQEAMAEEKVTDPVEIAKAIEAGDTVFAKLAADWARHEAKFT